MHLSEVGERQAWTLGDRMAGQRLDAIHTSPRLRARRTAEAIAARTGAQLGVADALDEIDFGAWTGRSFAELEGEPEWRDWNEARGTARCPDGESMAEAADRVAGYARELARSAPGARLALVSHADTLRGLVARILGLPLDNMLSFEIAPASVSRLEVGDWGGRVLSLNETLPEEGLAGG